MIDKLEQQQRDKELATESLQQASEELKKQIETKPEQLSEVKKWTMEKKLAQPETTSDGIRETFIQTT